jgi:N-acetylgalactosamine kinase
MTALNDLKERVVKRYIELTGEKPLKICAAPGRVNLIGEHIDYNGYGVLPCAVGRFTVLAIGISKATETRAISIATLSNSSPEFDLVLEQVEVVPKERHHWSNYVLAAYLGLRESGVLLPRGLNIVVGGNLPQACGLSSSSSLVVASAMSMSSLRLSRQFISPEMLADICMKAEWHVGTAGGGMDQAAIILSKAGFATSIQFNPLRTRLIQLPSGISIIVANSLARSAKAETAHLRFNKRVFECKVGLRLLRQVLTPSALPDPISDTFAQLQKDLGDSSSELIKHCREIIPENSVSKDEISQSIGPEILELLLAKGRWGRSVWDLNTSFYLLNRAVHVLSEASRVDEFISAAATGDIQLVASLMNASGISCDEDYDCSCDELRNLISDMKDSGCLGARLTGAGWGGCAVGVCNSAQVETVVDNIKNLYFKKRLGMDNINDELVFSFEPANGAVIIDDQ